MLEVRARRIVVVLRQRRAGPGEPSVAVVVAITVTLWLARCAGAAELRIAGLADVEPPLHACARVVVELVEPRVASVQAEVAMADRDHAVVARGHHEVIGERADQQALEPRFDRVPAALVRPAQRAAGRVDRVNGLEQLAGVGRDSPRQQVVRGLLDAMHALRGASPSHRR